jgi:hypothetical protein
MLCLQMLRCPLLLLSLLCLQFGLLFLCSLGCQALLLQLLWQLRSNHPFPHRLRLLHALLLLLLLPLHDRLDVSCC